ncbi:hypothetical protein BZZ01_31480 [Nostocales cyanobacterium HT-58-2]|nr:hypothetical protein BZZ01_31480 [Nostocales cyanobacterium HT-58-2]
MDANSSPLAPYSGVPLLLPLPPNSQLLTLPLVHSIKIKLNLIKILTGVMDLPQCHISSLANHIRHQIKQNEFINLSYKSTVRQPGTNA